MRYIYCDAILRVFFISNINHLEFTHAAPTSATETTQAPQLIYRLLILNFSRAAFQM